MNRNDPKFLALFISLIITGFFTIVFFVISYFFYEIKILPLFITDVLLFAFCYLILNITLRKFIYDKIRLIYKTIHNLKVAKGEKKSFMPQNNIIENVNIEVQKWKSRQVNELEKLKELEMYRREFLGNISHELKTPIFNIQGYVLTLLDGGLEDPSINKQYLRRTEKSINRMIAIVEDLETIAHLEANELQLDVKKFDIVALTRDVMDFLDMKAKKKKIEIYLREEYEKPVYVLGDQKRIRQVLINLIDNSIRYGRLKDGKTKISFFDMDENILVEVTDNGEGIDQQDLQRVFERFYRTEMARAREVSGTGLGLAIVKHIIEAHNQTINVRSKVGLGSTFAFTMKKAK